MKIITKNQIKMLELATTTDKDEMRDWTKSVLFDQGKMIATDSKLLLVMEPDNTIPHDDYPVTGDDDTSADIGRAVVHISWFKKVFKNVMPCKQLAILDNTAAIYRNNDTMKAAVTDLEDTTIIKTKVTEANYPDLKSFIEIQEEREGCVETIYKIKVLERALAIAKQAGQVSIRISSAPDAGLSVTRLNDGSHIYIAGCAEQDAT